MTHTLAIKWVAILVIPAGEHDHDVGFTKELLLELKSCLPLPDIEGVVNCSASLRY